MTSGIIKEDLHFFVDTMDNPIDLSVVPDQVNMAKVVDLLTLANISEDVPANNGTEDATDNVDEDGPMTTRARAVRQGISAYSSARDTVKNLVKTYKEDFKNEKSFRVSVKTAINCVVQVLSDVIVKVNAQGGLIKEILEKLKNETPDDSNTSAIRKLEVEMQNKIQEKQTELEADIKYRTESLEKEFQKKHDALEKYCDEGRQREMKGTIIVSSPQRGRINTLAVHKSWPDSQGYITGESDLDLVLRMIQIKTGVRFPICDVVACHRIGKKESNSFVLKIGNRQPFSSWDALTHGMMTGNNFNQENVFINFMLTKKRTEMSKQVRQLRKDSKIKNYSIDQNGKFCIRKIGDDTKFHEVSSIAAIENLINTT